MKQIILFISLLNVSPVYSQWNEIFVFPNHYLSDIECVSETEIYVVGTDSINGVPIGVIHHSLDGGTNWDTVHIQDVDRIYTVNVVNSNIVYATSRGSKVYKTIDGGSNWTNLTVPSTDPAVAIAASYFVNGEIGLLGNFYGEIFKTIDGGLNWQLAYFFQPFHPILDLKCSTDNICYASTSMNPHFLKSLDNGSTWSFINSAPFTYAPWGIDAINKDTIVAVSTDAFIHRTTDGATNWDTIPSPVNSNFKDVYFMDSIGFAVGTKATIIKSSDFGATWTVENFDSTSYDWINAVHMAHSNSAYACSLKGSIYRRGTSTSVNNLFPEADKVLVFPNPCSNQVTIQFKEPKNGIIEIYNNQGQRYHRIELKYQNSIDIDMSDINSSFVYLTFIADDLTLRITKKIIKLN